MSNRFRIQWGLIRTIWQQHEYRFLLFNLFFIGLASSSSMPLVTLFLVKNLHVPASGVGLFYLTALVRPLVNVATGRLSDRLRSRLPLIRLSAIWLAVGWGIMAIAGQFWLAIGVSTVFFCLTGTLIAQTFAAVRDVMNRKGELQDAAISSTIRTAYSLASILGPILGSWLATTVGLRFTFLATSCLCVSSLVPIQSLDIRVVVKKKTALLYTGSTTYMRTQGKSIYMRTQGKSIRVVLKSAAIRTYTRLFLGTIATIGVKVDYAAKVAIKRDHFNLVCFGVVCLFVLSGDAIKLAYLPLYVVNGLKQNLIAFGSLLSISAIAELAAMPLAGVLADKIGMRKVIAGGILIGVLDYALLANSTHLWQLYLVQFLHVGVISVMFGVGITYAQRLDQQEPGLASSVVFSGQSLATPVGGLIGGYGVHLLGMPRVFLISSCMCALSLGILLMIHSAPKGVTERDPNALGSSFRYRYYL